MLVYLTVYACLLSDPTACRQEQLPFDGGMMACAILAQQELATWSAGHPKYRVVRWSCGPDRRGA